MNKLMLKILEKSTKEYIKKNNWSEKEISDFINMANRYIANRGKDDAYDDSLVVHKANYSGGFIIFGGWTKIFDHAYASGTRGHELYLAFGGLGAGGWSGDCDIEINMQDGCIDFNGKRYAVPQRYYNKSGKNTFEDYSTGFDYFHDHVKSFMYMYLPQFMQPIPIFVYYDGSSNILGISVPSNSLSCGIGGGTVKVKS